MNLKDYFDKPSLFKTPVLIDEKQCIGSTLKSAESGIHQTDIAIIGAMEDTNSLYNKGCAHAPDLIRSYLYALKNNFSNIYISDFGNLKKGNGLNSTYFALQDVVAFCLSNKIIPIILGGSHELTLPAFKAYEQELIRSNIVVLDSTLDNFNVDDLHDHSFLTHLKKSKFAANISALGYQTFQSNMEDEMELYRLKDLNNNINTAEPVLRDAHFASFDISATNSAQAPGCGYASPNGLTAGQFCKLSQFAGFSDRLSCFGIFGVNPKVNTSHQTEKLAAQAIWHFLDGLNNRYKDYPLRDIKTYSKKIVHQQEIDQGIVFYHNIQNNRWWFNAGNEENENIVSCSFEDYMDTQKGKLPKRIMRFLSA